MIGISSVFAKVPFKTSLLFRALQRQRVRVGVVKSIASIQVRQVNAAIAFAAFRQVVNLKRDWIGDLP